MVELCKTISQATSCRTHPDVAAFWLPDFDELHDLAALGTGERVVAEAGFDTLAPGETLRHFFQRLQREQGELSAKGFQRGVGQDRAFLSNVARVEPGVAHHLHPFGRNMNDEPGDEVEGGAGDGLLHTGGGVDIPVGDLLAVLSGDVRSG